MLLRLICICMIGGCAQKVQLQPVHGTLLYRGQPAAGAIIVLHPIDGSQLKSTATVGAEGRFALSTYQGGDGVPRGSFGLTAIWHMTDANGDEGPNLLPARYALAATSGIVLEIGEDTVELPTINLQE